MAYNFMCEAAVEPNWGKLHRLLRKYDKLEFFPMLDSGDHHFGLAISVPMKNVGVKAYKQFVSVRKWLSKNFHFKIYDMYYGKEVDKEHIKIIKREMT